jgi:hypothetical protein
MIAIFCFKKMHTCGMRGPMQRLDSKGTLTTLTVGEGAGNIGQFKIGMKLDWSDIRVCASNEPQCGLFTLVDIHKK